MNYYPTIGLEIHAELKTKSKMFCSCKNDSDEKTPNINICPVCMGHPGTLPIVNLEAVRKVIKTGMVLNCQVNKRNYFERKNYFYPDLPKGYQITQYAVPLVKNGYLITPIKKKKIRIEQIHLEEDTARLIHNKKNSLIDFNRAGIPLMELVTEPDIHSAEDAHEFVKELQLILRYLGISDANMEKGEMRCEVNISLSKDINKMGTKVEIKNLNSLKVVEKGIGYEIKRQTQVLENNGKIVQETRGWNDQKEITISQRKKEEAHDYRYFPEPDIPVLNLDEEFLIKIKNEISELPQNKRKRFQKEYGIDEKSINILISNKELGEYFEKVNSELRVWVKEKKDKLKITDEEFKKLTKLSSNYIITDLQSLLKGSLFQEDKFSITPENFAEFVSMIYTSEISSKIAKILLKEMFKKGGDPSQIMKDKNLKLIDDEQEIENIVKEVLKENPKPKEDYKKGNENVLQFLIGQVMSKTKGKAEPEKVAKIFKKILS
jgi:aspartyl-tRNA(Asn)/glutamyl-tRNA(Gln) amidotransferase subunit B